MEEELVNWKGCPPPPKGTLEGIHVRLELLQPDKHSQGLYEVTVEDGADERTRYMWEDVPKSREEFEQWLNQYDQDGVRITFVIVGKTDNKVLGRISYQNIAPEHGKVEVGPFYYGKQLARSIAAAEASLLIFENVFAVGYRRCEIKVWTKNVRSLRACLRSGFHYEGTFRKTFVCKGQNRDDAYFSLTNDTFPLFREVSSRYIQPINIHPDGREVVSMNSLRQQLLQKDEYKHITFKDFDFLLED